jgi:hypothetical protein
MLPLSLNASLHRIYIALQDPIVYFGLQGSIVAIYFPLISKFTSRMQDAHTEEYKRLGEPSLFSNNTPANAFRLCKFILFGSYKELDDSRLNALGLACKVLLILCLSLSMWRCTLPDN